MLRKLAGILVVAGSLMSVGAVATISAGDDVPFPNGFRDWFVVNSMIVTKDSPMFGQIGGMHIIYVNAKGLPTLRAGGPFPYPDGTFFADDVHEFSINDGSYVEGNKSGWPVFPDPRFWIACGLLTMRSEFARLWAHGMSDVCSSKFPTTDGGRAQRER